MRVIARSTRRSFWEKHPDAEQAGLRAADMIPYLGSKSKVSEVLNGKRPLSLTMIRKLHDGLGNPAKVMLSPAPRNRKCA